MTFETIKTAVMKFVKDEDGLTIVEYAVAGGQITVAVAATFVLLGTEVQVVIQDLCEAVSANDASCAPAAG